MPRRLKEPGFIIRPCEKGGVVENERHIFTLGYYEEFVSCLRKAYHLTTFQEGKINHAPPKLIMRHDIDMDLESALRMSSLENKLGIHATYFFMVRCPLYNIFSGSGSEQVKQILANGHYLGLHFDCALYEDVSTNNLNYYVSKECQLLESFFENPVEAVSFHRPGRLELSGVELEKLPHTYERVFLEKFKYFSDSRGIWAYGNPLESEAFSKRENLHILVHPVWWTPAPVSSYQKLVSLLQQHNHQAEQYISENCKVWEKGRVGGKSS